ncbi:MAG: hypothetical protein R3F11_15130 [Verrucomicrobiales bacterium]
MRRSSTSSIRKTFSVSGNARADAWAERAFGFLSAAFLHGGRRARRPTCRFFFRAFAKVVELPAGATGSSSARGAGRGCRSTTA